MTEPASNIPTAILFKVAVTYTKTSGQTGLHTGGYRASNGPEAIQQARDFVNKYIRPASITDLRLIVDV
jgi:hypothetical protein